MSATRHPDRRSRRRAPAVALAVGLLLGLALAACGDDGTSGGSDGIDRSAAEQGEVYEIVVPRGTQERLNRGETVSVMPSLLEFRVGDTLRIRNEDVVAQAVGPYDVGPGEEFELRYGSPG